MIKNGFIINSILILVLSIVNIIIFNLSIKIPKKLFYIIMPQKDVMNMFGDRLKYILDTKEITQKELASKLNIAPTTLNGYITNKRQPNLELVKEIAEILNVSTDYLLDYNNNNTTLTSQELIILNLLRQMTPSERNAICNLLKVFICNRTQ